MDDSPSFRGKNLRWVRVKDGEWENMPGRTKCCDCGLIHRHEYRLKEIGQKLVIQVASWREKSPRKK